MPDILIRGMEMPKDHPVLVFIWPDGRVFPHGLYESNEWDEIKAIPLPEGYGNLIDMDAPVQVKQWTDEATRETTVARLLSKFNIVGGPKIIIQPEGGIKL